MTVAQKWDCFISFLFLASHNTKSLQYAIPTINVFPTNKKHSSESVAVLQTQMALPDTNVCLGFCTSSSVLGVKLENAPSAALL